MRSKNSPWGNDLILHASDLGGEHLPGYDVEDSMRRRRELRNLAECVYVAAREQDTDRALRILDAVERKVRRL